jgi:hypothetical protein
MKLHSNYTTAMRTAIRLRWGTATLLILAALIVGLILFLTTNGQSTVPTSASDSFVRHTAEPIASCRACRDEWVAAQMGPAAIRTATGHSVRQPQTVGRLSISRAAEPIASCRACRDEWVAAQGNQVPAISFTSSATFERFVQYTDRPGPK